MRLPSELQPAPRRWSLHHRPPFVEAYPTFSVGEAHRQAKHGIDHLVWRDRNRIVTGAARACWLSPQRLVVTFGIEERPYYDACSGELALDVTWKGSLDNNRRPFAPCPACGRHVDVLVHAGDWCCASKAHGLRHRSARLPDDVRCSEALADLEGAIEVDQALGATGKAHRGRVEQRDALLAKLGDRRLTANALHLAVVTTEWVRPIEPPRVCRRPWVVSHAAISMMSAAA